MQTRIKHFPTVPADDWGNPDDTDIPEHWDVERHDGQLGWWFVSNHATLATAQDQESSLHLHNRGNDYGPGQ